MTAEQHNKLLGFLLLGHSLILSLEVFIVGRYFVNELILRPLYSSSDIAEAIAVLMILPAVIIVAIGLILILSQLICGLIILIKKRSAMNWGIVTSSFAIICLPIGTVVGIYGLWFLCSKKGRNYFSS